MAKKGAVCDVSSGPDVPPTMEVQIVEFLAIGVSPLLQNNPAKFIGKSEGGITTVEKKYDDKEEARLRLYPDNNGSFGHPTEAFLKSSIKAVSGRKFGKAFATSTLRGSVFVVENLSIVETEKGKPAKKYEIDRRSVVIGKSRILRCRPCWKTWRIRIALEIDVAICSVQNVLDSLRLAGRTVGVGDYRPDKGGGFGRFTVELAK